MNEILIPILAVTIIGLICGVGLAVASHVMAVKEDERFPAIRECLPGANCGACGFTGCDGYAKALLTPGTKTNLCVPGGAEAAKKLAEVLGVEAEAVEPKVAIVRCGGDCEHTSPKEDYRGIASCQAAKLFFGGKGTCTYGCLGFGDCAKVCPHDAISWNNGIAAIDPSVCVGWPLRQDLPAAGDHGHSAKREDGGALLEPRQGRAHPQGLQRGLHRLHEVRQDLRARRGACRGQPRLCGLQQMRRLRRVRTGLPDGRSARSYRECRSEGLLNFLMAVQPPSLQCGDGGSSFPTEILRVFSRCKIRENGV